MRLGTKLEVAYFDQLRMQLELEQTVIENVAEGSEYFELGGERRHVLGYLQDFLFSPERARSPVASLSGGERNRLLLARLFAQPANVLVLDEPTNDLDIETLELLEERLLEFSGTILLVSHDRAFLDNVVTSTLAFEGGGRVFEYVGGYADWLRQRRTPAPAPPAGKRTARAIAGLAAAPAPAAAKLSAKERRELEQLPAQIEALERLQKHARRAGEPARVLQAGRGRARAGGDAPRRAARGARGGLCALGEPRSASGLKRASARETGGLRVGGRRRLEPREHLSRQVVELLARGRPLRAVQNGDGAALGVRIQGLDLGTARDVALQERVSPASDLRQQEPEQVASARSRGT